MKIALCPEPSEVLLDAIEQLAPDALVFAPWAVSERAGSFAPDALARFTSARQIQIEHVAIPGWMFLELGLRAWQRGRTDRRYRSMFARRRLCAEMLAAYLRIRRPKDLELVIAPSLAAREVFSATRAQKLLIEDLPGLRDLHRDLDAASETHSHCRFLRRFRARPKDIIRQESEWVLTDDVVVRGHFAAKRHSERNICKVESPSKLQHEGAAPLVDVALAGLAAARHGACEALALLKAIPTLTLSAVGGEGAEPAELLSHPRVVARPRGTLGNPRLVIAPSWVECYPKELVLAHKRGLSVIATERAAATSSPQSYDRVEPGDIHSLIALTKRRLIREARRTTH